MALTYVPIVAIYKNSAPNPGRLIHLQSCTPDTDSQIHTDLAILHT